MDAPRIAVLTPYNEVKSFLDNSIPNAMHYFDDTLHTYLKGSAYTYEFKTFTQHEDVEYLVEGNKLSFNFKNKGYYLTIMQVERAHEETRVLAYGLCLELTNEQVDSYSGTSMTFKQYIDALGFEKSFVIGVNEVSDKKITHEWSGSDTILARLYSLATVFSAELEFVTELNNDYSLKQVTMNVYREHDDSHQGIGVDKTGQILRYPTNIYSITKTSDITELYTAIRPTGTDGLQVTSLSGRKVYDSNGRVLYEVSGNNILAPQARDRFPSTLMTTNNNDMYAVEIWSYDTSNVETLYGQALAELKKHVEPTVSYEVDAYVDANIGDTFTIEDSEYSPTLYLQARITEQEISFTNVSNSKTTFDNFKELQSQIDASLKKEMESLIAKNKVYEGSISSTNGILFKTDDDSTLLTALVKDNGNIITSKYSITWYKDGESLSTGASITVKATDFETKAVYRFEATDGTKVRASAEVTCMRLQDGEDGTPSYLHIAYANSDDGLLDFSLTDSNRKFMGQYSDQYSYDSEDPTKYRWSAIKGEDAQSLVDYVEQFYNSTSTTECVDGEWYEGNVEYVSGRHLWKRYKATYENPSEIKYTTPIYDNTWDTIDGKLIDIARDTASAITKADEANTKAESASTLANESKTIAEQANTNASDAVTKAEEAQSGIDSAQSKITEINTEITTVKSDIQSAVDKVNEQADEIASVKETYATKVELEDESKTIHADVSTEIEKKVGELATTVSETYSAKTDLIATENKLQTQITQNADNISSSASKIETLEADTTQAQADIKLAIQKATDAQTSADTAIENAQKAQDTADKAQSDLDTANEKLTKAQTDLDTAKANLETVTGRVDASEKEIAEAQSAIETAEANVAQAQKDVASAKTTAEEAKTNAETAKTTAENAQTLAKQTQDDLAKVTNRVTTAETNIKQNADDIALRATKTELSSLEENVYTKTESDANLQVSANDIKSSVASTYATTEQTKELQETLSTQIKQSAESITAEVTQTYVKNDTLNEYKNDVSSQISLAQSTLQKEIDGVSATTEQVKSYMTFNSDGLELGKSDSTIKTVFGNDSWKIVDNGTTVVSVTNQTLTITNAIFLKEVHIGDFAFVPRANGSLDFKKVG